MISISQQTWLQPWIKLARGEQPAEQLRALTKTLLVPLAGVAVFLALWAVAAGQINTSLGAFPGPMDVWQQGGALLEEHAAERREEEAFYERQRERNAERQAVDPSYQPRIFPYTGSATFIDQILTSLMTVTAGFVLASLLAIPLGIALALAFIEGVFFAALRGVFLKQRAALLPHVDRPGKSAQ